MTHDVLVDGHNVMHRLGLRGRDVAVLRARVIERVRAVAPRRATVYFDGHPSRGEFGGTEHGGVTVRYAGDVEADEAIVERVRASRRPRSLVVVTDDLELARRAEQLGASSLRVSQFLADLPVERAEDRQGPGGFSADDFGLPATVDLDRPPSDLDGGSRGPARRVPPRPLRRK